MPFPVHLRSTAAVILGTALVTRPAFALVSLNDGTDRIFVTGTAGYSRDSNIFSANGGGSDSIYSTGVALEYTRKAGWIGVNGGFGYDISRFEKYRGQDFENPRFSAELTKQTGRTTGSLTLGAQRQSRADAAVNTRVTSWNYNAGLNVHYPVIERYSLSGGVAYNLVKYVANPAYADLATYSANLNLYYILSNERDLFVGYRFRYSDTKRDTHDTDNSVNIGVTGRILPRLNGSLSVGYQVRKPSDDPSGSGYGSTTASGSVSYAFTKKLTLTGIVAKDFATTASDTSIDTAMFGLNLGYTYSAKFSFGVDTGYGRNRFLGPGGLIPDTKLQREDTSFEWGANIKYTYSQHFSASVGYSLTRNWSNLAYSDFQRGSWNANASSRW